MSKWRYKKSLNGKNHRVVDVSCSCGYDKTIYVSSVRSAKGCPCCVQRKKYGMSYEDVTGYFISCIKSKLKRGNKLIEFNITAKDIYQKYLEQNKKCALSGVDINFFFSVKNRKNGNASLDRIDSAKGYIAGNIQLVHKDINRMKNSFDQDYFIRMCKLISLNNQTNLYVEKFV
jgi:transposase